VSNDRWKWAPRDLTGYGLATGFLFLIAAAAWLSLAAYYGRSPWQF
jgi:hypothetical protein